MLKQFVQVKMWVAALVFSMFATGLALAQTKPPLKIGAYLSVTGPGSFLGSAEMKAVELYVDMINNAGGVDGRKIELYGYDDESNAARANTLVKRLIENDKVHAIIGGSLTGSTMSAVPLVERAGVPMLSLAGGTVIIDPIKKFVFKMTPTDAMAVDRLYNHMNGRGIKSLGVIAGTDAFGRACLAAAQKIALERGMKVVREESFNTKDTDMTVQLTNLRQESGIKAILNCAVGDPAAIITKNYKQLAITLPHYSTHANASDTFIKLAGAAAEGMIMANGAVLVWSQLPANDPQNEVVQAFVKAYRNKYGEVPSYFAGLGADALLAIRRAVERSGSTEPGKIRDFIEKDNNFVGVSGIFHAMSETDHMGLTPAALRVVQIANGSWKLID
ncbi:MAG: ABC transporter substrate-binding protein [Pseudomonadota bacterium]